MNIDYGSIIRRSVELIKKNKWLWVYGLVLAVLSGGGNGSSGRSFTSSNRSVQLPKEVPGDLPEKSTKVLGEAVTALREWFSSVPFSTWVVIGIGFIIVFLIWILISWVITSWAKGGLIAALEDADNGKTVTLTDTSPKGKKSVINLILLSLISLGLIIGITLVCFIVVVGGTALLALVPPLHMVWLILSMIVAVVGLIVVFLLFTMVSIYAERLVILKGFSPWAAWKKGLMLSKGNFLPTLVMGFINTSIGCVGGCLSTLVMLIILGIPGFLLVFPLVSKGVWMFPGIPTIAGIVLILFLFITASNIVRAAFVLFNFSNWNLLFKEIWNRENMK